jgi:hypothetical protein
MRRGARRLPAPRGLVASPVSPACAEPPERAPQPTTASTWKQWGILGGAFALQDQTSLAVPGAPAHDHKYCRGRVRPGPQTPTCWGSAADRVALTCASLPFARTSRGLSLWAPKGSGPVTRVTADRTNRWAREECEGRMQPSRALLTRTRVIAALRQKASARLASNVCLGLPWAAAVLVSSATPSGLPDKGSDRQARRPVPPRRYGEPVTEHLSSHAHTRNPNKENLR